MAGEWIKVTTNLHTKPEVFKLARLLSLNVDSTVGYLVKFWCWADMTTVDGVVDGVESQDVDAVVTLKGFCNALAQVGWVEVLPTVPGIRIPNFDRHNGESAKKRVLKNERQARWRAGKVDAPPSTKASTRVEKRREEIKAIGIEIPEWVPNEEWSAFVEMRKKGGPFTDRSKTLALRELEKLRDAGHDPRALIDMAVLKGWKSFYPPKDGPKAQDLGHYK